MEALFRVPSKAIQYGYIEVAIDVPDDPAEAAAKYLDYVSKFQISEREIVEKNRKPSRWEAVEEKPSEAAAPTPEESPEAGAPSDPEGVEAGSDEDVDRASKALAEGLGGVTQVPDEKPPWENVPAPAPEVKPWDSVPEFDFS